jgi:hypothetical protein
MASDGWVGPRAARTHPNYCFEFSRAFTLFPRTHPLARLILLSKSQEVSQRLQWVAKKGSPRDDLTVNCWRPDYGMGLTHPYYSPPKCPNDANRFVYSTAADEWISMRNVEMVVKTLKSGGGL